MATHHELGQAGEEIARHYLEKQGYRILEKNWRYKHTEIDLIALQGELLVFIEVKTRASNRHGYPEEAVTRAKERALQQASAAYLRQLARFRALGQSVLPASRHSAFSASSHSAQRQSKRPQPLDSEMELRFDIIAITFGEKGEEGGQEIPGQEASRYELYHIEDAFFPGL